MTYSLALDKNGDLKVASHSLQTVSGEDKVKQDIFTWVTEAFQSDRFHPNYGSIVSSYVGSQGSPTQAFEIEVEVVRVLGNLMRYQRQQVADNPDLFSFDEIIDEVESVTTRRGIDSLVIDIVYRLASNPSEDLTMSIAFE